MKGRATIPLIVLAVLSAAGIARGDELHLKDGTKITGTIVGFENDSFKVETAYGFALVRKDKVAEIIPSDPKKEASPKAKADPPPAAPLPAAITPAVSPAIAPPIAPAKAAIPASKVPAVPVAALPAVASVSAAAPPPPEPAPPVIRDEVRGNLYVNHTYGFQMFKPPDWDIIPGANKTLPNAIAALGTNDETTLLVLGLEHTQDSLATHAAATEKALGEIYDNYRSLSSRATNVAGIPAIERRARGTADGHDWSVILLTFLRGHDTYTLLGVTWAQSDLIQMQENVISKTMNSLTFVTP